MILKIPFSTPILYLKRSLSDALHGNDPDQQDILVLNIQREKLLSGILIGCIFMLFIVNWMTAEGWTEDRLVFARFSYLHGLLFLTALIFLAASYFGGTHHKILPISYRLLHIAIALSVSFLSACIAVCNIQLLKHPYPYTIAMLAIGSLIFLSLPERLLIFLSSYLYYLLGFIRMNHGYFEQMAAMIFTTLLVAVAFLSSSIHYSSFKKMLAHKRELDVKNEELQRLNELCDEDLQRRTRELKEAAELEQLRSAFFANLSHELQTPLTVIYSASQMLAITKDTISSAVETDTCLYGKIIKQNSHRMMRLVTNLIDITRIDAGYYSIRMENCDIVRLVEDISLSVAKYIEDRGVRLVFDTEMEELIIACDPDKMERIILNLLSNAVKFTPRNGNITVYITNAGENIKIHVQDTGIGIPVDIQKTIFQRFVQADNTFRRHQEGSGIGLSLVRELMDLHHGTIEVKSEPEKGSKFILTLPRITLDNSAPRVEDLQAGERRVERIAIEFSDIYQ